MCGEYLPTNILSINQKKGFQMTTQNAELQQRQENEAMFIAKAWEDESFKQELISDPKAIFAKALGSPLPEDVKIQVLEETQNTYYLVIPKAPEVSDELSDEALESVAGGCGHYGGHEQNFFSKRTFDLSFSVHSSNEVSSSRRSY